MSNLCLACFDRVKVVYLLCFAVIPAAVFCQNFQFRLDGAVDGTFVNNGRQSRFPSHMNKSPWRYKQTLFVDRVGQTGTLTVTYDHLSETVGLKSSVPHLDADESFDYGLTAHLFTSSTTATLDPSSMEVHVLMHAATDVPVPFSSNASELCIIVAFKSETLQSHSVCSLSWPLDTVCIVGRSLDRRWFIGNKLVNVSFSIHKVSSRSRCSVNYRETSVSPRSWYTIGRIEPPGLSRSYSKKLLKDHRSVELSSSEVGHGRPQVNLLLPSEDMYFRVGDLIRLPVHLHSHNSLASLLIRVNASPSLQLSEMRLLHPDWRLSIISDNNNRVAVIRATADPSSNSSAIMGGPLLEYDFRVIPIPSNLAETRKGSTRRRREQRHRTWASAPNNAASPSAFLDHVVVGTSPRPERHDQKLSSASLSWEVEMVSRDSASVGLAAVDAVFHLDNDAIVQLVAVVKVTRVFNYAVLRDAIQRIPFWLYGFTSQGALVQLWDAECVSSDRRVIKVEKRCRYLYLDGSETRGSDKVGITVERRRLKKTVFLSVLFPDLPLTIEFDDAHLQLIQNFLVPAEDGSGKCVSHFQRTNLRVSARFSHLAASPAVIDADVTEWLRSIVRVVNTSVADYNGRAIVGLSPGTTIVQLVTAAGQLIGSSPITVSSSHSVSITRLDALIADRIAVNISPVRPRSRILVVADNQKDLLSAAADSNFFDVTASLRRVSGREESASSRLFVIAHFSDGTFMDLAALPSHWYELSIQPSTSSDAAVPRVALFEVAKCRRQSVNERLFSATTIAPNHTVPGPLSVIRIDGSDLFPGSHEIVQSEEDESSTADTTTLALAVVLGALLVVLFVLTIIALRHRIQLYLNPDHPVLIYGSGAYHWLKGRRLMRWFAKYVIEKPKQRFDRCSGIAANDMDAQSTVGEELVCEPPSRPDRNWVWLSRETLEKNSIDTMKSHPLLPEAAFRNLCCSAGTGTGTRSPAVSTTGSSASRSACSSAAPLLRNSMRNGDLMVLSATEQVAREDSPVRNLVPTVYTGSECSLRIQPMSKYGSAAALQLVAPDGKLMATAFASRTLDHRRRARGYQNELQLANSAISVGLHQALHSPVGCLTSVDEYNGLIDGFSQFSSLRQPTARRDDV